MSFADSVWKLERIAPGFSQRFTDRLDRTATRSRAHMGGKLGGRLGLGARLRHCLRTHLPMTTASALGGKVKAIVDGNAYMTVPTADEHGLPWAQSRM